VVDAQDAARVDQHAVMGHPARVLLGSVSQHVNARAPCPVGVVREPADQ
jgi:nucleotide-binding universal stress UspA family protein